MTQSKKKGIRGILLLILLSLLFGGVLLYTNTFVYMLQNLESRSSVMKALSKSVEKVLSMDNTVYKEALMRSMQKTALSICAREDEILKVSGGEPCYYLRGAVIRVSGDEIDFPDSFPKNIRFDASQLTGQGGMLYSTPVLNEKTGESPIYVVSYFQFDDSLYYIEWNRLDELENERVKYFDANKSILGIEKAFNTNLMIFPAEEDADGQRSIIYVSGNLPLNESIEDYGITKDMIERAVESYDDLTAYEIAGSRAMLTIGENLYEAYFQEFEYSNFGKLIMAYLVPIEDTALLLWEQTLLIVGVFFFIGVFLLVWFYSVMVLVHNHSLNESQKRELEPRTIRRRSFSVLGVGGVTILAVSALFLSLFRLFSVCQQVDTGLLALRQRIEENQNLISANQASEKETYEGYAVQIAGILEENPEFVKAENLQMMCDIINAEYIMLFDSNGNETLSNSRYSGLSLGKDPSSATYEFRHLLTGTRLISHEAAFDEATMEENVLIGVSFGQPGEDGKYGALLLAVPKERIYESTVENPSDIMSSLVAEGMLAFSVDPETAIIRNASDASLIGNNAVSLGLPENALEGGYRDFFTLDGLSYYGECDEIEGTLYYYAAHQSHIYQNVLPYSVVSTVAAFILLMLLAFYMLHGYRKYFEEWSEVGEVLLDAGDEVEVQGGRKKYSLDPSRRWKDNVREYGIHAPGHIARVALQNLLVIWILIMGFKVVSSRSGSSSSLISFILAGKWAKGVNLFAITSILILLAEVILVVTITKFILRMISDALGTKGETICRLLSSLASYSGVILFLYFSLYYLGLQPNTLLASLGLLSFAVSLGAKDLITDIIAGLSIVFEGEYQVGDIIDVGGYRGKVLEIGVRTTKLQGSGSNIKIIGNRDVKNVINMTRMNSWCPLEISISSEVSLPEVEKMLSEQLPALGESIPEIVSGPFYRGVVAIGKGVVTLSITAECNEENYYRVQRALNRAVQELFEKQGIRIM